MRISNTEFFLFFQAEDGIRYGHVTGVQTCALPIMYGPVAGSGFVDASFAGEAAGRRAANSVAMMYWKSPCGCFSLIVITPVASSAVIPPISPFFEAANSSAPTMFEKKPTPGESIL